MNCNGRNLLMLIETNTNDAVLAIISTNGNGHVNGFIGNGEFDENDQRSVANMQRRADLLFVSSTWSPPTRNYFTFGDLINLKGFILSAMRFTRSKDALAELNQAKRLVLRALGEIESE